MEEEKIWYLQRVGQNTNGREQRPKIDPYKYNQLIFDKGVSSYNGAKMGPLNKQWEQTSIRKK